MNRLFRWNQTGLFLLALAAGILPFAVPEVCAAALREGLTLCSGPLLLSLFPFLVVSRLLVQCPESDLLALPFRLAAWGIGIRTPCAARVLCIGFLGGFAPAVICHRSVIFHRIFFIANLSSSRLDSYYFVEITAFRMQRRYFVLLQYSSELDNTADRYMNLAVML